MTSATALYRNYSIDLAQDVQGWRVVSVTHCVIGSRLLPPAFCYPDRSTAERYARAAIDMQLSKRIRRYLRRPVALASARPPKPHPRSRHDGGADHARRGARDHLPEMVRLSVLHTSAHSTASRPGRQRSRRRSTGGGNVSGGDTGIDRERSRTGANRRRCANSTVGNGSGLSSPWFGFLPARFWATTYQYMKPPGQNISSICVSKNSQTIRTCARRRSMKRFNTIGGTSASWRSCRSQSRG